MKIIVSDSRSWRARDRGHICITERQPLDPTMSAIGTKQEDIQQRRPNLWFDDGGLVLQVEQTVFKVYRALLCDESASSQIRCRCTDKRPFVRVERSIRCKCWIFIACASSDSVVALS